MIPAKIRYKGRDFEHNPETLSVRDKSNVKEESILFDKPYTYNGGKKGRVVVGRGQLVGEDCINRYADLLKLQYEESSGILSLPEIKPFFAFFTRIELSCDPTPDFIEYEFEFVEDCSAESEKNTPYFHICSAGENLWDVSFNYSVPIETLVELNPNIRYIKENLVGQRVRIC